MPGKQSQINGRKGGRPKGSFAPSTLSAMAEKAKLIEMYKVASTAINLKLIEKALQGDMLAIREIHERVWGKAFQSGDLDVTSGGQPIEITDAQYKQALLAAAKRISSDESSA